MQEGGLWTGASALAVAVGSVTEAITYTKSASLHLWLLGYEFTGAVLRRRRRRRCVRRSQRRATHPSRSASEHLGVETVLVFTKSDLHALAGPKKTDILAQLGDACTAAGVTLHLHPKPKKEDGSDQIAALLAACKGSSDTPVVGTLPKVRCSAPLGGGGGGGGHLASFPSLGNRCPASQAVAATEVGEPSESLPHRERCRGVRTCPTLHTPCLPVVTGEATGCSGRDMAGRVGRVWAYHCRHGR